MLSVPRCPMDVYNRTTALLTCSGHSCVYCHPLPRWCLTYVSGLVFSNRGLLNPISGSAAAVRCRRPNRPFDLEWVATTKTSNFNTRQALMGRLSSAQSHLHKEAIRTAYLALAEHDLQTGSRSEGMANLMRSMDYCTTRTQTAQISVVLLEVAFGLESYSQVRDYVTKVEHTVGAASVTAAMMATSGGGAVSSGSSSSDILQDIAIKLEIASGIERMVAGDYERAARILIPLVLKTSKSTHDASNTGSHNAMNSNQGNERNPLDWPGVTSPEDLALYASVMGMVTQNREQTLRLAEHPDALELVPAVKDLLLQWSRSNYVNCMQAFAPTLDSNDTILSNSDRTSLLPMGVDVYLSPARWKDLARKVRESCLVEYLRPYQRVRLETMQQLFPSLGLNLVDVLVDMMSRGLLPRTRLDCRAGILFKVPPRKDPTRQLQVIEEKIMDDVHALMIRLACLGADLCVYDPNNTSGRMGGPRDRSGGGRRMGRAATMGGGTYIEGGGEAGDSSDDENFDDNVITRVDEPDTHMMDADAAMNPEDRY
jgi:hypothetical protein